MVENSQTIGRETRKETNNKHTSTTKSSTAAKHTTASTRTTTQSPDDVIRVVVLGPQGCGKSSLINAAHGEIREKTSTGFEPSTVKFHPTHLTFGKLNFELVDSPGFDSPLMSDNDIFSKLAHYLCHGRHPLKLAGVIYIHPEGNSLASGALRRNLQMLKDSLGGDHINRITFLLLPRSSEGLNHDRLTRPLLDSKSPFAEMCALGARIVVSQLKSQPIRNILLHYGKITPELVKMHDAYSAARSEGVKYPTEKHLQRKPDMSVKSGSTRHPSQSRHDPKNRTIQRDSADLKRLQRELAESNSRIDLLNGQLEQTRAEYASLRSQLQIHENIEQGQVIQDLVDLNRRIEDFGHSFSQHLIDTYVKSNSTSRDALQLAELQRLFGHGEGKPSLVQSSTGVGMPLDDFFDLAARSILCEQLQKRIFVPFHPTIPTLDPRNSYTTKLYNKIREEEPQPVAGRWRTAAFDAISRAVGPVEMSHLKSQMADNILNENLMPLPNLFFGSEKKVELTSKHLEDLKELVSMAWDWNTLLKGKVILLGDLHPRAYQYGSDFDVQIMSEFEPMRRSETPTRILSTIGIGLSVSRALGAGQTPEWTVLHKASVVSENRFEK